MQDWLNPEAVPRIMAQNDFGDAKTARDTLEGVDILFAKTLQKTAHKNGAGATRDDEP